MPAFRAAYFKRLILALLAGISSTILIACHRSSAESSLPPPEVGVSVVSPQGIELTDEFNGRVQAVDAVQVRPRVSGYLERITAREGDYVQQGAILFVIDQRPYRIAAERASAQLSRARAAADLAQVQLARIQKLMESRATSQEDLDNTRAANLQADADLKAAQAAVDDAALNLSFTEVRAPIAGRVGRALFTVGNLARADESLLTTLVSQDPVYIYFDCDEQSLLRYNAQRGASKGLPIEDAQVHVRLANEQSFPHAGTVEFLDNQLDSATGTILARVRMPNPDHKFIPGLYARVRLSSAREGGVLLVDDKAVLTDQDRKYLYVIGPNNHALRRDVTTGRIINGREIIEKGLQPGDRVVVEGLQKIFYPGTVVKPVPLSKPSLSNAAGSAN